MNFKAAWKALLGDSKRDLREELIGSLKRNIELERTLKTKKYEIINVPKGDDEDAYNRTIEQFHDNRWIFTFFTLQERELIQKFKNGGDAEILRGALVAIDDIVGCMADVSDKNKRKREQEKVES